MYGSGSQLFEILPKSHICPFCSYKKSLDWDNPFLNLKNRILIFHILTTEFVSSLKK
ncbi:hypothetical protein LEP1GSC068_0700 [Leptospira sp. Fiocruz LV3954]|nr:hypothetical protein LEP1GSC068_0700 [Leptospira sp. Fiocruz LV3954]EKS06486.1 hypothetical protein LEP1GSC071_1428 [Leptospira santarosai str. JET]EMI64975.1 hypothetical protein LEP1GSC076_0983 [Leptospira sp. Fiocruz LV4135]